MFVRGVGIVRACEGCDIVCACAGSLVWGSC